MVDSPLGAQPARANSAAHPENRLPPLPPLILPIAIVVLHLLAVADVWLSRLSPGAKVLWSVMILCLVGPGLLAWMITRHTAYQRVEDYAAPSP